MILKMENIIKKIIDMVNAMRYKMSPKLETSIHFYFPWCKIWKVLLR